MGYAMSQKPSRPFVFLSACVACTLLALSPATAATAPRARILALPEGTVTKWTIALQPSLRPIPFSCEVAMPGPWAPRFAPELPSWPMATDTAMALAQRVLPLPAHAYNPAQVEGWIADALARTQRNLAALAREKERQLALLKEEQAQKARADAAYVPPAPPPAPAPEPPATAQQSAPPQTMPLSAGSLLQAPVAKAPSAPAAPAPAATQPAAVPNTGSLMQAPVALAPAKAPAKTPETAPQASPPAPAKESKDAKVAKDAKDAKPGTAVSATPGTPGGTMHAGSLMQAPVKTPAAPSPAAPPAPAPGKQVAALTPPPPVTAPPAPPTQSIVPKSTTSRSATQDPTVLATPEGKQAHDSFRQFCTQFVQKVASSYDKGTITNMKVEKRGNKYVAQYMNVDQNSVHLLVKNSGYDHTPFVGILQYSEQLLEAEGETVQAAKAGAFKVINSVTVRELFRYANKKWHF